MVGNYESLTALAERIEKVEKAKEDYIVSTQKLTMDSPTTVTLENGELKRYNLSDLAHQQIAARLSIPRAYYEKAAEIPGLREQNVNAWWQKKPELRMVRTLEGNARAYLSNSFRPYDNFDAMQSLLPVLREEPELKVFSQTMTERRMYLQFVFPRLHAEIKKGDVIQAGITITNSEVGLGAVDVRSFLMRLVCMNGAIAESLLRKYHLGRRLGGGDEDDAVQYRSDTIEADVRAFQLQLRDIVRQALSESAFQKKVGQIEGAAADQMRDPEAVIVNVTKRFGLSDVESRGVTRNLIMGADTSRWGLANSITALAKDMENQDRQYEVEKIGWEIVELRPQEWEAVNN